MAINWRTMPNGNAKYRAYLASRDWALLREAVKQRSGGTCEHCRMAPGTQTHHQTYERIYREPIEDLLHVCGPCHLFLSGKSDFDPSLTEDDLIAATTSFEIADFGYDEAELFNILMDNCKDFVPTPGYFDPYRRYRRNDFSSWVDKVLASQGQCSETLLQMARNAYRIVADVYEF